MFVSYVVRIGVARKLRESTMLNLAKHALVHRFLLHALHVE